MTLMLASPSYAEGYVCQPALNPIFSKYGIDAQRITITSPVRRKTGGTEGVTIGTKYWLPIKDCNKGYLIVDLDLDCYVDQIFTSGPCKLSGVPDC
jgi:hypothetical protein